MYLKTWNSKIGIEIKFNIPEDQDLCEMDEEGLECVPRPGYNKAMHQKFIVML